MEASPARANVHVVSNADDAAPGAPAAEPEADGHPATAAPPQELEHDLGGPTLANPTAEELVGAVGGSVADKMRARFQAIAATEEFAVPGWELPNGEPGLIIEAKTFGDRKAYNQGISNEVFIARSTNRLFFVDDEGRREEIPGGWGPALADMIGIAKPERAADLVALVISKPDPDNPASRIPNVAGIGVLATLIINWAGRGTREAEDELGG